MATPLDDSAQRAYDAFSGGHKPVDMSALQGAVRQKNQEKAAQSAAKKKHKDSLDEALQLHMDMQEGMLPSLQEAANIEFINIQKDIDNGLIVDRGAINKRISEKLTTLRSVNDMVKKSYEDINARVNEIGADNVAVYETFEGADGEEYIQNVGADGIRKNISQIISTDPNQILENPVGFAASMNRNMNVAEIPSMEPLHTSIMTAINEFHEFSSENISPIIDEIFLRGGDLSGLGEIKKTMTLSAVQRSELINEIISSGEAEYMRQLAASGEPVPANPEALRKRARAELRDRAERVVNVLFKKEDASTAKIDSGDTSGGNDSAVISAAEVAPGKLLATASSAIKSLENLSQRMIDEDAGPELRVLQNSADEGREFLNSIQEQDAKSVGATFSNPGRKSHQKQADVFGLSQATLNEVYAVQDGNGDLTYYASLQVPVAQNQADSQSSGLLAQRGQYSDRAGNTISVSVVKKVEPSELDTAVREFFGYNGASEYLKSQFVTSGDMIGAEIGADPEDEGLFDNEALRSLNSTN